MTPDPDDEDAFSWEGDEHPTRAALHRGSSAPQKPVPAAADRDAEGAEGAGAPSSGPGTGRAVGASPEAPAPDAAEAAEIPERQSLGNVALVASGILGGIYLLYAIGWIIGGLRVSRVAGYLVSTTGEPPATWAGGNVVGIWLAALAPVLWFLTVWVVTRRSRPWVRWTWLIAGAVLLVPWPLFMLGAQG